MVIYTNEAFYLVDTDIDRKIHDVLVHTFFNGTRIKLNFYISVVQSHL